MAHSTGEQHESITDHSTRALRPSRFDQDERPERATTFLYYRGPFRIFYKRQEEYPRLIAIDNGSHSWEILCKSVDVGWVRLSSQVKPSAQYPEPEMVLEGRGAIYVDSSGHAVVRAAE